MAQTFDIVISYRREDTQATSSAIYREMVRRFGADRVLLDITSVPVGEDYQRFVDGIIARARALIVVIGPEWLTVEKDGVRRLDREDDAVRAEVVAALAAGVPIIPLLVDGASAPEARALPEPLRPLSRLNMMPLSERHWDADMQTLAKRLAPLLGVDIKDVSPRTEPPRRKLVTAFAIILAVGLLGVLATWLWGGREPAAPKLETPDFQTEGDQAVLTMSDPFGKRDARLVNAGGSTLRYTLAQFPDRGLYVIPGIGPDQVAPKSTRTLQFVLGYGASDAEYRFVLSSDVTADRTVVIRVPDLAALQSARQQTVAEAARELSAVLSNDEDLERLRSTSAKDTEAPERVLRAVKEVMAKRSPDLDDSAQWVLSAELVNAANWPGLAIQALRHAEQAQPEIVHVPSVQSLASVAASLAGAGQVFTGAPTETIALDSVPALAHNNPFTAAGLARESAVIAEHMKSIPSLAAAGLSLEGDLKRAQGRTQEAVKAYADAEAIRKTPSISRRILETRAVHSGADEAANLRQVPTKPPVADPRTRVRPPPDVAERASGER
jgi:hypothetical protein